ncbi:MAG: ice-binding family protein, partial [Burkholderiales bacterium]
GAASFTVTCVAPCANATGTVALDPLSKIATFTLATGSTLTPGTLYTGTVTGAKSLATGLALATPYKWQFTTGLVLDTTRPRVTLTAPITTIPGPTGNVPTNTAITAVFTKDMAPATINATSFTVTCTAPCVSPAGTVSYAVGSRTAVFTPTTVLAAGATYTATITTAATDLAVPPNALAGNQAPLPAASNYVWLFTTATPVVPVNISVLSTSPTPSASGICPTAVVNATFNVPFGLRMDPLSVNTATFLLTGPAPALAPVTAASVVLDVTTGQIATFTPLSNLTANVTYTATIKGGSNGVKDLIVPADTMVSDYTWNFTAASCAVVIPPTISHLGSASTFGIMATAAITNVGFSIINGNVSLEPGTSITGFPPGVVNGSIHTNDSISHQARADLLTAYNYYKSLPPGVTISAGADLGALYPGGIPPGTYTSGSTMLVTSPLVLDAGGNAGAIWVFQIGSSLTAAANVTMLNGGSEKNVFWVPTSDATVGGPGLTFSGTLVTGRDVTSDGGIINGRILAGAITAGTVALSTATVINVPAP